MKAAERLLITYPRARHSLCRCSCPGSGTSWSVCVASRPRKGVTVSFWAGAVSRLPSLPCCRVLKAHVLQTPPHPPPRLHSGGGCPTDRGQHEYEKWIFIILTTGFEGSYWWPQTKAPWLMQKTALEVGCCCDKITTGTEVELVRWWFRSGRHKTSSDGATCDHTGGEPQAYCFCNLAKRLEKWKCVLWDGRYW